MNIPKTSVLLFVVAAFIVLASSFSFNEASAQDTERIDTLRHRTLDEVPGFGRSPDTVERDDLIALREEFQREQIVADCMSAAGFSSYRIDVAFPVDAVQDLVDEMSLPKPTAADIQEFRSSPASRSSDSPHPDGYWLALTGVTENQIREYDETGLIPLSWTGDPQDFLTGGCTQEASENVSSVWKLRRQLMPEIRAVRNDIPNDPSFGVYRDQFKTCVAFVTPITVNSPAELEELRTNTPDLQQPSLLDFCPLIWTDGVNALFDDSLQPFMENHQDELALQIERHSLSSIETDTDFYRWLSVIEDELASE